MNITIRISNPLYFVTLSAALLLIGWAIGARWGHSATAGYALFGAIAALLVRDAAMAILASIGGYKLAMHLRNTDRRQ
ncbi:MAG TPA: hypothetical protein VJQ54_03590 [Candidatus Sulfotelmatobacter sp.]|nr:hypothetical protein [Candidatus Sulfotelmatobacter sp.]